MIFEVNYLTVLLATGGLSVIGSLLWAAGRSLLNQYGTLLRDQIAEHRADFGKQHGQLVQRLDALKFSQDAQADRITKLEYVAETAPSHDDIKRIHARIDKVIDDMGCVAGDVKALDKKAEGMSHMLGLIHEYLLNNGVRK